MLKTHGNRELITAIRKSNCSLNRDHTDFARSRQRQQRINQFRQEHTDKDVDGQVHYRTGDGYQRSMKDLVKQGKSPRSDWPVPQIDSMRIPPHRSSRAPNFHG